MPPTVPDLILYYQRFGNNPPAIWVMPHRAPIRESHFFIRYSRIANIE
jgi:hypothetical protein